MNEIHRVLRGAAWRVGTISFLRNLVVCMAIALAGLVVLRIVEQTFAFTKPAPVAKPGVTAAPVEGLTSAALWEQTAWWTAGGVVLVALAWTLIRPASRRAVARRVDEGANLREALSTALCIEKMNDPWSRATLESAARSARGVRLSAAVPITAPRFWPVPLALALTLGVVFLSVPRLDVMGWFKQAAAKEEKRQEVMQVKQQIEEGRKKLDEMVKKLDPDAQDKAPEMPAEKPEAKTPEELKVMAVKELTKLSDKLEAIRQGEKGQKIDALKDKLAELKNPGKELTELTKALNAGDFTQAKAELQKLKEQAASSGSEAKAELAKQLEKMAEQMEKLAKDRKELEKQLEKAGLDKKLASDPKALAEAMKKADNLTPEQKEALEKQSECQSQCQSAMEGLSSAMSKAGKEMKEGESGEGSEGMEGMEGKLSELEMMAQEMEQADAAMSECQSQMASLCKGDKPGNGLGECQGEGDKPWSAGWNETKGKGRGGPGQADGGSRGESAADFTTEKKMDQGLKGASNRIVGSRLVEGESIRGESKAEFLSAVAAAGQAASEDIENNVIPREYHDAIKTYFGRLKAKTSATTSAPGTPAPAAATDPNAKPAKDAEKK